MNTVSHHHYNPDWLSDDDIVTGFVARQSEFEFLINELEHAPLNGNVQHYLLVGLRGAGKTTLLKRLAVAIRRNENLKTHLIALSFPEELYQVKNLADFWWAACDALLDEFEFLKWDKQADDFLAIVENARINNDRNDLTSDAGFKLLQQICTRLKRRPVLLVDNLDVLFDRIDKTGRKLKDSSSPAYWALREALSTSVSPIVIGGSVRLSSHFTDYDNAFYDFFIAKRLGKLSLPEVLKVLDSLADVKGVPEIKQRLRARPGRIEALFELTGGNPRALGLIFELLRNGPNSRAVEDFERLMDLTTPYYKARIEDLAEQAQVVMHALAVRRVGAGASDHLRFGHTAAEIGSHAGLPTNTVSTQLGILENEGLVEKSAAHGRTQYRIAEQLFRLWLQMRSTRRIRQNVLELTKFFEAMYDADELLKMAMYSCGASQLSEAKYAIAVAAAGKTTDASRKVLEGYATEQIRQHVAKNGGELEDYLPANTDEFASLNSELSSIDSNIATNESDDQTDFLKLHRTKLISHIARVKSDPSNVQFRRDLAESYTKLGDILAAREDLAEALASHEAALDIRLGLVETEPTASHWRLELSFTYGRIGNILLALHDLDGALASHKAALAIRLALVEVDPANMGWRRYLSVSYGKIGDILTQRDDLANALASYEAALAIRLALVGADPTQTQWQRDLSVSYGRIGNTLAAREEFVDSEASHAKALAIRLALVEIDPSNVQWKRDLCVGYGKVGDVLSKLGDLAGALASHEAALAILVALVEANGSNHQWLRELSVSYGKVGDILFARGDIVRAQEFHEKALVIDLKLVAHDETNSLWRRDLSVSYGKMGDILSSRDDFAGALEFHKKALGIRLALVATDVNNLELKRDLSMSYGKVGDALAARNDLDGALSSHEAALAIDLALAEADPTRNELQRDLSVSYGKVGNILRARGDFARALESHEAALAIRLALVETDPMNLQWRRDLSVGYEKIADILTIREDLTSALSSHQKALAIRLALVQSEPSNTQARRELACSYGKIGDIEGARDELAAALISHEQALAVLAPLVEMDPTNSKSRRDLSLSYRKIGDILAARNDLDGALVSHNAAFAIRVALVDSDPANIQWRRDLSISYEKIGNILDVQGNLDGALASHEAALAIRITVVESDPVNIQWQLDLARSRERIGDILVQRDDWGGALKSYEMALEIETEFSRAAIFGRLRSKHADTRAQIYATVSTKAFFSGDLKGLRQGLRDLIADPVDIATVLVSKRVVEGFLATALVKSEFSPMLLNEMRELGFEKHARPLVLAFEAAMTDRGDLITELEPELQSATMHMFKRLQDGNESPAKAS